MSIRLIHRDIKNLIEIITDVDAYPIYLPALANIETKPAIVYRLESATRGDASDLQSTTTSNHIYTFFIFSRDFGDLISLSQKIIDAIEGDGFTVGATKVLMSHVTDVSDDYDHTQSIFIQTIQVEFFVSEN